MGEALQRLHGLAHAEHQHQRRVGGQLDVDVIAGTQLLGDLIARAAGAADVDHHPEGIPARDPGPADHRLTDHRAAGDRVDLHPCARRGGERAVQQRLAVRVELAPRAVQGGQQQEFGLVERTSARSAHLLRVDGPSRATCSIADWVRLPTILWVEARASAPGQRRIGQRGMKAEMEPHAQSTTSAAPAAWTTSAQPRMSAAIP